VFTSEIAGFSLERQTLRIATFIVTIHTEALILVVIDDHNWCIFYVIRTAIRQNIGC